MYRNKQAQLIIAETISPRRKCTTPKRITTLNVSPNRSTQSEASNSDQIENTVLSSPLSSTDESSEVIEYVVNRQLIYDELLKCKPLQEKLASKINKRIASDLKKSSTVLSENSNSAKSLDVSGFGAGNSKEYGNIEMDLLPPEILQEILNSILDEPECNELVELVIEKEIKEIQSTNPPSKLFSSTAGNLSKNKSKSVDIPVVDKESTIKDINKLVPEKQKSLRIVSNLTNKTTDKSILKVTQMKNSPSNMKASASNANGQIKSNLQNQQQATNVKDKQMAKSTLIQEVSTAIEKCNTSSGSNVQSPFPNIIVSGWPNSIRQPYFIPSQSNLMAEKDNNSIILTTFPQPNHPVIYLNDSYQIIKYPTSTPQIQANVVANQTLAVNISSPNIASGNKNQEMEKSLLKSVNEDKSKQKVETNVSSSEQPNSSHNLKSPRAMPTILSKSKGKFIQPPPDSNPDSTTRVINTVVKETMKHVIEAKKTSQTSNTLAKHDGVKRKLPGNQDVLTGKTRSSKRKVADSAIESSKTKRTPVIDNHDSKIKVFRR